jgi:hypothetical protein
MRGDALSVNATVFVYADCIVRAKAHSAGEGFILVSFTDRHSTLDVFFDTVEDLDRVIGAMQRVRHELGALTEVEPSANTAIEDQVATHANAA